MTQHDDNSVAENAADALDRLLAECGSNDLGGGGFTAYYREDSKHSAEADVWAVVRHYKQLVAEEDLRQLRQLMRDDVAELRRIIRGEPK